MRILVWLFRAFLFFLLFAFSLNNQQPASMHWFFGYAWTAPLVIIVLVAFAAGIVVGVLAMAPSWWRQRRLARRGKPAENSAFPSTAVPPGLTPLTDSPVPLVDGI